MVGDGSSWSSLYLQEIYAWAKSSTCPLKTLPVPLAGWRALVSPSRSLQALHPASLVEWGPRTHSRTCVSASRRALLLTHRWTYRHLHKHFPSAFVGLGLSEAGERDLLIINLEHLIGLLWEGHCPLRQNNHRISRQDGKRKKMIHYFTVYFAFSLWNGWRFLTICEQESKA